MLILILILLLFGLPLGGNYYGDGAYRGYGYGGGLIVLIIVVWLLVGGGGIHLGRW